jgi:hypothetical protein
MSIGSWERGGGFAKPLSTQAKLHTPTLPPLPLPPFVPTHAVNPLRRALTMLIVDDGTPSSTPYLIYHLSIVVIVVDNTHHRCLLPRYLHRGLGCVCISDARFM